MRIQWNLLFGCEMNTTISECCGRIITASLGDGIIVGFCSQCQKPVCRMNPRTGVSEWLDNESVWSTRDDLRRMPGSRGPETTHRLTVDDVVKFCK